MCAIRSERRLLPEISSRFISTSKALEIAAIATIGEMRGTI